MRLNKSRVCQGWSCVICFLPVLFSCFLFLVAKSTSYKFIVLFLVYTLQHQSVTAGCFWRFLCLVTLSNPTHKFDRSFHDCKIDFPVTSLQQTFLFLCACLPTKITLLCTESDSFYLHLTILFCSCTLTPYPKVI